MTKPDLLPCPFCGGEAYTNSDKNKETAWVECFSCRTEGPWIKASNVGAAERQAEKEWNIRADTPLIARSPDRKWIQDQINKSEERLKDVSPATRKAMSDFVVGSSRADTRTPNKSAEVDLDAKAKLDAVYSERMLVVSMLAKMSGCSYGLGKDDNIDWEDEWRNVVYIDLPQGQVSWHIAPTDMHLFEGFPEYTGKWDGTFNGRSADFAKSVKQHLATGRADADVERLKWQTKLALDPGSDQPGAFDVAIGKTIDYLAASGHLATGKGGDEK